MLRKRNAAIGDGVLGAIDGFRLEAVREESDDVDILSGVVAAIDDVDFVDGVFADRDRAGRIADVELQVGEGDDVCRRDLAVGEIAGGRGGGDFQLVLARRADRAFELHEAIVARAERTDSPQHFAAIGIKGLSVAGADELGAFGQVDVDGYVLGGGRAWIADAEEVSGGGAGVLRGGTAPVDFKLRLAAEEILRGFEVQAAFGGRDGFDVQLTGFTGGQFDFDVLAGAGAKSPRRCVVAEPGLPPGGTKSTFTFSAIPVPGFERSKR